MKFSKLLIILGGLLLVFVISVCAVLFQPSWQRRIAIMVLSKRAEEVSIGRVNVHPGGFEISDMRVVKGGKAYIIKDLKLKAELLQFLWNEVPRVDEFTATGVQLDMSQAPVKATVELEKVKNLLPHIDTKDLRKCLLDLIDCADIRRIAEIPDLQIGKLACDGLVLMQDGKRVQWVIEGSGVEPGKTGNGSFTVTYFDEAPIAELKRMDFTGKFSIVQELEKPKHLSVDSELSGIGTMVSQPHPIVLSLMIEQEQGASTYEINAKFKDAKPEQQALFKVTGDIEREDCITSGRVEFGLTDGTLKMLAIPVKLPPFDCQGTWQYSINLQEKQGVLKLNSIISVSSLAQWFPAFAELGALSMRVGLSAQLNKDVFNIQTFVTRLIDPDGLSILEVKQQRPVAFNLNPKKPLLPGIEGDFLLVEVDNFPMAVVNEFLPDWSIGKGKMKWSFGLHVDDQGLIGFRTHESLLLEHVTLKYKGDELIKNVKFNLFPSATYSDDKLSAHIKVQMAGEKAEFDGRYDVEISLGEKEITQMLYEGFWQMKIEGMNSFPKLKKLVVNEKEPLEFSGDFKFKHPMQKPFFVDRFSMRMKMGDKHELMYIRVPQGIEVDPAKLMRHSDVLAQVQMKDFPLDMISPFLADGAIEGEVSGDFKLMGNGKGALELKAEMPLEVNLVNLKWEGVDYAKNIAIKMTPNVIYKKSEFQAHVHELRMHPLGAEGDGANEFLGENILLSLEQDKSSQEWRLLEFSSKLNGSLNLLRNQALGAYLSNINGGRIDADIGIKMPKEGVIDCNCKLALDKVTFGSDVQTPYDIHSTLRWKKGSKELEHNVFTLELKRPDRVSDLHVNGAYELKGSDKHLNLTIDSNRLNIDDLMQVSNALTSMGSNAKAAKPDEAKSEDMQVAQKPIWSGFQGKIDFKLAKVEYQNHDALKNLNGCLLVAEDSLTLSCLDPNIKFYEAGVGLQFRVMFDSARVGTHYHYAGNMEVNNFNMGYFLSRLQGGKAPIEGYFDMKSALHGALYLDVARTLADLGGNFKLKSSSQGVLHTLSAGGTMATGSAVALGVAGLVNAMTGNKLPQIEVANNLVRAFADIRYHEAVLEMERLDNLNWELKPVYMIGPEILFFTEGQIYYKQGTPLVDSQMRLVGELHAKGDMAEALKQVGMLSSQQDEYGYYLGPKFNIRGTPSNPDFSELENLLRKAATSAALGGANPSEGGESGISAEHVKKAAQVLKKLFK